MNYLLLNGRLTSDINLYIRDSLALHFSLDPKNIPFNTDLGIENYVLEDSTVDFIDKVRSSINSLLISMNNRHDISLALHDITFDGSRVLVEIDLDDGDIQPFYINSSDSRTKNFSY